MKHETIKEGTKHIEVYDDSFTFTYKATYNTPNIKMFEEIPSHTEKNTLIYLGKFKVLVHHSGVDSKYINREQKDVLSIIVKRTWFKKEDIALKLIKEEQRADDLRLESYNTYMVYGIKHK